MSVINRGSSPLLITHPHRSKEPQQHLRSIPGLIQVESGPQIPAQGPLIAPSKKIQISFPSASFPLPAWVGIGASPFLQECFSSSSRGKGKVWEMKGLGWKQALSQGVEDGAWAVCWNHFLGGKHQHKGYEKAKITVKYEKINSKRFPNNGKIFLKITINNSQIIVKC